MRHGFILGVAVTTAALLCACHTCPPSAPSASEPLVPVTGVDTESTRAILEATETFANKTCACATANCADSAANEFALWLRAHPERSGSAVTAKRVLVAMEKMLMCRDRLDYPGEVVDLDAPAAGAPPSDPGG